MRLSIVVPVYNVAGYLPKCVASLLAQDLEDCEILLVDDGSTDGISGGLCDEYAQTYPQTIRTIHKPNGGLGDARNVGLEAARGDYVLFVDSDDYLAPEAVQTLRAYMDQDIDVTVFGFWLDSGGAISSLPEERLPLGIVTDLEHFPELLLATPSACNKLWKRALFLEHGIRYPSRVWYEDMATTGKLLAKAKTITALEDRLYYYVIREGSITRNNNMERNLEILDAVGGVMEWYRDAGLFSRFSNEFEALTVKNVLLDASVRVLKAEGRSRDRGSPDRDRILKTLMDFTVREFPNWHNNSYLRSCSWKHRIILELLRLRQYRLIRWIFSVTGG